MCFPSCYDGDFLLENKNNLTDRLNEAWMVKENMDFCIIG